MPETIKTDHSEKPYGLSFANSFSKHENSTNTSPTSYTIATMLQELFSRISRATRNFQPEIMRATKRVFYTPLYDHTICLHFDKYISTRKIPSKRRRSRSRSRSRSRRNRRRRRERRRRRSGKPGPQRKHCWASNTSNPYCTRVGSYLKNPLWGGKINLTERRSQFLLREDEDLLQI